MKIVHVVEPFASGVAVFVKSLVENLTQDRHIVIHGDRKAIAPASEVKKSFSATNVIFIPWKSAQRSISLKKDVVAFIELYQILKRLKKMSQVDAVHLHSSKSGFLGRLVCWLTNIKNVIYTPNGAPFLSGNRGISNFVYMALEKIGNLFGGKVVCCSASEKKVYEELGIKALMINNGVPLPATNTRHHLRGNKNENSFTIVTCARITSQKNPSLFNAIARQFEDMEQFRFVWVGDGEERGALTSTNIEITGWQTEEEAHQLVSDADVYLSTSHFEGLSFSVLEALAFKKPVLLKRCVGNQDVVKSGLNGDLFDFAEQAFVKILSYYNNRKMLPIMGEYSNAFCAEEFDVLTTCSSYQDLYASTEDQ